VNSVTVICVKLFAFIRLYFPNFILNSEGSFLPYEAVSQQMPPSVVSIVTSRWAGRSRNGVSETPQRQDIVRSFTSPRPALGPSQLDSQWVLGGKAAGSWRLPVACIYCWVWDLVQLHLQPPYVSRACTRRISLFAFTKALTEVCCLSFKSQSPWCLWSYLQNCPVTVFLTDTRLSSCIMEKQPFIGVHRRADGFML
jgi:hypothetical protein